MRLCGPQIVFVIVVVVLGIGSMLSGCGKKGPLYLPDENRNEELHLEVSQIITRATVGATFLSR